MCATGGIIMSHTVTDEIQIFGQGSNQVIIREDGYVNATDLCKSAGKKFNDYSRLGSTNAFLDELSNDTGIPVSLLVQTTKGVKSGASAQEQGTWVHPDLQFTWGNGSALNMLF